ncbi:14880_t:CDS:2, partial [Cetraspora pellucida]
SLTLAVNNQNWILDFEPKDDILKQKKRQSYVRVMDQNHISRNTIRSLAKINSEIECEYKISEEKININKIMQGFIPLSIIDINADISNTTEINNGIHIDDPNIVQDRHYTIILYPGIENYIYLQKALIPLIQELDDINKNGINDKFGNIWNVELYFSSDWKFLALCLGLNNANATYFCPYCNCNKKEIGLYNKNWKKKNMNMLVDNYTS